MTLAPYRLPVLPEYRSRIFKKAALRWRTRIRALLSRDAAFKEGRFFAYHLPVGKTAGPRAKQAARWTPKLYVCVDAQAYWPFIMRLIKRFGRSTLRWKFYMAARGCERPDKIVFYFDSGAQLRRFVKTLRPLMPKRGFHELRHAVSTTRMGLEPEGRAGLYVGIDPPLKNGSWRIYRCLCLAWAEVNEDYLEQRPGGRARWFERMNLSTEHEGPLSLSPDPRNDAQLRRCWRAVLGRAAGH